MLAGQARCLSTPSSMFPGPTPTAPGTSTGDSGQRLACVVRFDPDGTAPVQETLMPLHTWSDHSVGRLSSKLVT
jgi:hypothetical protein